MFVYSHIYVYKSWFIYEYTYKLWIARIDVLNFGLSLPPPNSFSLTHVPALDEIRVEFKRLNQSDEQANFFLNDFDVDKNKSLDAREFEVCACMYVCVYIYI